MGNNNTEQISNNEVNIAEDELSLQIPIGGVPYQDWTDDLDFYFRKPDGTQYAHLNWSAPQIRYGWWNAGIELPDVPDLGVWEVEFQHNGSTILTDTFTVLPESSDTVLTVDTLVDENDGDYSAGDLSLREAIALANEREGADIITFDDSLNGGIISLTETEAAPRPGTINQELLITDSVQIDGLGANNLTIDGVNGGGGIFRIEGDNIDVTLTGLNIVNGFRQQFFFQNPTFGGAILVNNSSASLSLQNSVISGSSASYAGAISSNGDVNIFGSLIENNVSGSGGEFPAGAIRVSSSGNLNILNSTVANNSDRGITSGGATEITNSTIVDGIQGNDITLTSSIVLNDSDSSVASVESNSDLTSGGNNLVGNGSGINGFVDSDLVGTAENPLDPQLGELQDNGGLTKTLALQEGSPAIDGGSNPSNLTFDQRGIGFNRTIGNATDIGAYEVQNNGNGQMNEELVISTLEDENDGDFGEGDLSLREAIAIANEREGADTITFDNSLNGGAIALDTSLERDLIVSDSLSINGLGQDNLTLDGSFFWQIIEPDINLVIDGLNINGGKIDNSGNLTFSNSTIANSFSIGTEGSAIISRGTINIADSTIKDGRGGENNGVLIELGTGNIERSLITNHEGVLGASGVIILDGATVDISNSTIANNRDRLAAGVANAGTVNITNSTIVNNGGLGGGGIANPGTATVTSSIIAGSISGSSRGDVSGSGLYISGGNNLIGNGDDATAFVDGVNGDIVGTDGDDPGNPQTELLIDPQLGELQDNGGSTQTIALLEGSPAIDAGSNPNNLATDQRGEGFDRTVGSSTDIGAYEVQDPGVVIPDELVVSTLEDENDGDYSQGDLSLREAIALANENQIITFDSSLSDRSIILSQGSLLIDRSININGLGANNLTIDGNRSFRIFLIDDGDDDRQIDVSVSGLTLKDGSSFDSDISYLDGGGFLNRENLTVSDSVLTGNRAGNGGAIFNTGNLQLENSLVTASDGTGPINNDGGAVSIVNSTFTNNHVPGVSAIVNNNGGTLELTNSTITENSGFGAALFNSEDSTATVASTIVAGNLAELPEEEGKDDILGNYISQGNNLIGTTKGGSGFDDERDLVGTESNPIDPQLGELQDNGGATQTIALLAGSPAIDAGSNPNNLATDQRGEGFERTVGNGTDIGAYEVQDPGVVIPDELVVSTLEDENDGDYSQGDLSLREAIALANEREGADTITFNDGLSGNIVLAQGELTIADSVTIDGNNGQNLIIDGNNSDRIFKIDDGNAETNAEVTLDGLLIENGNVNNRDTDNTGGGIFNRENLTVVRSTISYNSAELGGGIANQGNLTLQSSYVDHNYAFEAGGIYTIAGNNQIIDSSINNNNSNFTTGGIFVENATIDIDRSLIDGNSTGAFGGGININNSVANINHTTISNNSAGGNAGGISSGSSNTTINNSTISGNTAASNGGIVAGNSRQREAEVIINNSTITGNAATVSQGGGVKNYVESTMTINNSTITGNFAAGGAAGVYQQESFIAPDDLPEDVIISGTLNLTSTIVAGNEGDRDLGGDSFNSGGNNLIGNGDSFTDFFNSSQGDLVGTADNPLDPQLGELQENGGFTQTIALLEGSPAIDAGSNPNNLATDQRGEGFARTVGNSTDIGAYEVQTPSSSEDIIGTDRSDFLLGTESGDRIFGLDGADYIDGLTGDDFLNGGNGNDYLLGRNGADTIEGDAGNDLIEGGDGADTIDDGAGNDVLFGGRGDDIFLASNSGYDLFTGGQGADLYVYDLNSEVNLDRDSILDFSPEDKIVFPSLDEFADLDTNGSGILDSGDDRIQIIGASTTFDFSDLFGRSPNSDTITLVGANNLDASNFFFNEID